MCVCVCVCVCVLEREGGRKKVGSGFRAIKQMGNAAAAVLSFYLSVRVCVSVQELWFIGEYAISFIATLHYTSCS